MLLLYLLLMVQCNCGIHSPPPPRSQDFDDWDDVGLNIPKPPTLLELFRDYSTAVLSDKERLDRIKDLVRKYFDIFTLITGELIAN